MSRKLWTALTLLGTISGLSSAASCAHARVYDYESDDPVAEALCAFTDSGDYRVLAIRIRDSVIAPFDSSLPRKAVNLERPPGGFFVFLKPVGMPGAGDRPSEIQLSFMKLYNSVIWTLLQSGPDEESLPPNLRLKLSWRGGRLKGNSSILIAAAAPRSLCAIR